MEAAAAGAELAPAIASGTATPGAVGHAAPPAAGAPGDAADEAWRGGEVPAPIRVLLVDDEEPGLVAMRSALAELNVQLVTAGSGRDALRAVLQHDFALILLDVRMPGLDGFETAEMIRARGRSKDTPIIFLTGAENHMLRAYRFGAVDFLVKPFPVDVLRSKVRVFVELAQAREHLVRLARAHEARARASEDLHRELLEHAGDAILLLDPAGGVLEANRAAERLFGIPRRSLERRAFARLFPDEREALAIGVLGERAEEPHEWALPPGEDGAPRWCEVSITPISSARSPIAMAIVRDVTERRRAAEAVHTENERLEQRVSERTAELEQHRAELNAALKELEAFSYSVAHDLRAPLRSIIGYTHALGEDCAPALNDQASHYLDSIAHSTRRMSQLIDDLLNLSRVSRHSLERQRVDVSDLAHTLLRELQERQPERRVEIVVQDGLQVNADPALFRLVLDNLLSNAWKFTAGRDRARIEVMRDDDDPTVLMVRDNGVGFDRRFAHLLFRPFERLHGEEFEGTGVGLAIVDRIIRRHGGEVTAESVMEEGATFSIRM
ncbi:MAG TPA: response regulator [Candidatus Eisenbacteria bacterium]|nr:response regulator [Candidatus Eisenbacteria bacterium]